ncbi:hypothetical protein LCGC14_0609970 [marine sediment metagenome]|uniref:Uncharacterized protein n=1 Tax=marine sediment metagenome TaxID=412755 RepID=A0A0F9TUB6_9ZZZZ
MLEIKLVAEPGIKLLTADEASVHRSTTMIPGWYYLNPSFVGPFDTKRDVLQEIARRHA